MSVRPIVMPEVPVPSPEQALTQLQPELEAMSEDRIRHRHNLDSQRAAETILGNLGEIETLRGEMTATFPDSPVYLDKLPVVASAALGSTVDVLLATDEEVVACSRKVRTTQERLIAELMIFVGLGLLSKAKVEAVNSGAGYRVQITNLLGAEALLRKLSAEVGGRTFITTAELDEAVALAMRFQVMLARRAQQPQQMPAGEVRLRVLSLLIETYGEVLRRVRYLRRHFGDAADFAPSLWTAQRDPVTGQTEIVGTPPVAVTPVAVNPGA